MKSEKNRLVLWSVIITIGSILSLIGLFLIILGITSPSHVGHGIRYYEYLFLDGIFLYIGLPLIILGIVKLRKNTYTKADKAEWASKWTAMKDFHAQPPSGVKSPGDQAEDQPGI
jgi:uncharacterized membrane protein